MPSSRRFFLPLAALAIVAVAAFFYSRFFEISPPALPRTKPTAPRDDVGQSGDALDRIFPELSQLFPDPNDWRRQSPNAVVPSNRSVIFLFQNEPILSPDRTQLTLAACTIVFLATGSDLSDAERCRQALVFESTDRVILEFTKPLADFGSLDNIKFDFSSFVSGEMKGEVVLRSDMKSPTPEDDLRFQTRDLVFTEKQIRTNFEFSFKFGRNHGAGRGLTIDLSVPLSFAERELAATASKASDNPDDALRAQLDALRQEGNLGCGFSIEQIELTELDGYARFYLDDSFAASTPVSDAATSQSLDAASYIDVRCKKGVYFSSNPETFGGWCVRFNNAVEVVSYRDGAKAEQLLCGSLYLYFQDPELEKLAAARPDIRQVAGRAAPTGTLARLVPSIVRAQRSQDAPTLVRVDDEQIEISSDEIQYDVRRRVLKLFSNEESGESARLRAQTDARVDFSANAVQIQLDENNKPQTILASGTGKLDAYLNDGTGAERRIQADWQNGLRVAPEPNQPEQYKLSTQGAVAFYFDGVGTFSAREADFWAQAVAPPADADSTTQNQSVQSVMGVFNNWRRRFERAWNGEKAELRPERWDVVVFRAPTGRATLKRVVGLPGETVEIIDGDVFVDGRVAPRTLEQILATATRLDSTQFLRTDDRLTVVATTPIWNDAPLAAPLRESPDFPPTYFKPSSIFNESPTPRWNGDDVAPVEPVRDFVFDFSWSNADGAPTRFRLLARRPNRVFLLDFGETTAEISLRSTPLFNGKTSAGRSFDELTDADFADAAVERVPWNVSTLADANATDGATRFRVFLVDGEFALTRNDVEIARFSTDDGNENATAAISTPFVLLGDVARAFAPVLRRDLHYSNVADQAPESRRDGETSGYFLLGDNSPASLDSRFVSFGTIEANALLFRVAPPPPNAEF